MGGVLGSIRTMRVVVQVRVFSVQRTHSAFDARQQCRDRTYCYHLPAAALGLAGSAPA